ncbi:MAG: LCP family protein [Clostridia bacterium]|nr:LCP family protein [Clostridia bacterium]
MRKDIREAQEKREAAGKGLCKASLIIGIVYAVLFLAFEVILFVTGIIPTKFLVLQLVVLLLLSALIVPMLILKKAKRKNKIVAIILAGLLGIVYIIGGAYLINTVGFLDEIFGDSETITYDIIAHEENPIDDESGLPGATIHTTTAADKDKYYGQALQTLAESYEVEFKSTDESFMDLCKDASKDKKVLVFVSDANYDIACDQNEAVDDNTKIVAKIKVEKKALAAKETDVTTKPFNILISGNDTKGEILDVARSDVNIIVSVNPVTKNILLTTVPRDYFVYVPQVGASDKLTHTGNFGVDCTAESLENLLGIDINYYVKVNFTCVTELVDAIGGIDVVSEYDFTTSGRFNNGYKFKKGVNHCNGKQALAFSRERHAFAAGDIQRAKDQQIVLSAIIEKCTHSSTVLTNYSDILDSVAKYLRTNMSSDDIKSLVKMQFSDMASWHIETNILEGTSQMAPCYSIPNLNVFSWIPSQASVTEGQARITSIFDGGDGTIPSDEQTGTDTTESTENQ